MIVKRIEYLVFLFFVISNLLIGQTYTVNSTNDVDDGTCDGIHCSLREAINDNENGGGGGTINFSVGAAVITLTAALPAMAAQVFIDGTSNTGFVTNTVVPFATTVANPLSYQNMVCIDGGGTGAFDGLVLNAGSDGSLIKGLVLRNFGTAGSFGDYGIHLNSSSSHTITACYIGIDTDGSTTTYNTDIGIYIVNSANNLIGDGTASGVNLISGCNISGFGSFGQIIMSGASSTGNIIKGNIIGLQKDGTTRASKYATGILLTGVGTSNTIGGTGINDGNLISGNSSSGIFCSSITTPQYIYGNRIGTTSTGSSVITGASNPQTYGIYLSNSYSLIIGGTSGSFRNIISANTNSGVYLTGSSSSANQIKGNYIGIASDGATFITSNTQDNGVYLTGSAQRNTIGGTATGEGNVISGNSDGTSTGYGVYLNGVTSNTLLGNTIGPQVGGSTAVTSTTQSHGVYCNGCYGNTIGGNSSTIARNIISGNCDNVSNGYGIYLTGAGASSNTIIGNYIGVNSAGTGRVSNGTQAFGIYLASGAKSNRIGGTSTSDKNVISSNRNVGYTAGTGIHLSAATSNTIIGNVLGLQADGITNSANSISQYNLALYNASFGNYIGGSAAGEGNIISMASQYGLYLDGSGTSGNIVRGNYIGVGSDGATKSGYQEYGVYITNSAAFNTIGGNNTADANVISGNQNNSTSIGYGVYINGVSSNTVTGNIIGLQKDGSTLISSNGQHYGVYLANNSTNNTIGNTISSGRNILSGNATYGAYLTGAGCSGNNIKGNYIGLQSNGTTVVTSSSQDYGIYLTTSASANTIGGTAAGEGNVISGNGDGAGTPTGWGVYLNAASSNTVVGNFIGPQKDGSTIVTSAVASIQAFGVYIATAP
ncbi:MAG: CSLREA domain-containing protein [Bacteroidetes bacterium]|nr:CSLREA domain-containing protein [Bacteroidota bacterium]